MGSRGPAPKRADQRLGHRAKDEPKPEQADAGEVVVPEVDDDWHPIAVQWFESLGRSGQSVFYTSADWATAYATAAAMSREFKPQPIVIGKGEDATVEWLERPPSASFLTAWLKACSMLLVTEGDRRRVGLELNPRRDPEVGPDVPRLDDFRHTG